MHFEIERLSSELGWEIARRRDAGRIALVAWGLIVIAILANFAGIW